MSDLLVIAQIPPELYNDLELGPLTVRNLETGLSARPWPYGGIVAAVPGILSMVFDPRRSRIYATADKGIYQGNLVSIDPANGAVDRALYVGDSPANLVLTPDGNRLFLAINVVQDIVVEFDIETWQQISAFGAGREDFSAGSAYGVYDIAPRPGHPNDVLLALDHLSGTGSSVALYRSGERLGTPVITGRRVAFDSTGGLAYAVDAWFVEATISEDGQLTIKRELPPGNFGDMVLEDGAIVTATWTPEGVAGDLFEVSGSFMPPPPDYAAAPIL